MHAEAIKVPYGETFRHVFECFGLGCNEEKDAALFVIRDKQDNVIFWKMLKPVLDQEQNVWTFPLIITHSESEGIPAGSYKYGLTFYKGYTDGNKPDDTEEEPTVEPTSPYQLLLDYDGSSTDEEPEEPVEEPTPELPAIEPIELDGDVKVLIAKKNFTVLEAVAREDGISRQIDNE